MPFTVPVSLTDKVAGWSSSETTLPLIKLSKCRPSENLISPKTRAFFPTKESTLDFLVGGISLID